MKAFFKETVHYSQTAKYTRHQLTNKFSYVIPKIEQKFEVFIEKGKLSARIGHKAIPIFPKKESRNPDKIVGVGSSALLQKKRRGQPATNKKCVPILLNG